MLLSLCAYMCVLFVADLGLLGMFFFSLCACVRVCVHVSVYVHVCVQCIGGAYICAYVTCVCVC